jgi:pimeloyl-ACP methyl ester carboxylesterase
MTRRSLLLTAGAVTLSAATDAVGGAVQVAADDDAARAAAWRKAQRLVPVTGGEVAVVQRGAGPAALFLHGFPLSGFQWRHALERLSGARRCIAPDSLGLGETRVKPGASVAPDAQVAMLAELLDRLDADAVDLVASDSGGAVAQLFAVAHPQRVRTLLLTNCDAEPNSPPPALEPVLQLARAGVFASQMLAPWARDKALARSKAGLGGLCYSRADRPTDAALDIYLGAVTATPQTQALVDAYAVALDPNPLAGIEAKLKTLKTPARIVWGMQDDIFDTAMADYLHRTLPGSTGVRRVEQGKLFWPEEYPDILAEEALRLWGVRG